jgi:hypothetical protein
MVKKPLERLSGHGFSTTGEESEALIRVAFDSLGQKQRVLEPYSLSDSSMVASTISQNLYPEHSNRLSRKWRCLHFWLAIFYYFNDSKKCCFTCRGQALSK